jgi:Fe-S cluster assembly ATP-binding protein
MLNIKNFSVSVENKNILNDVNFTFLPSTVNYLFGKNGAGKSSLVMSLIGHPVYQVTGQVMLEQEDITQMSVCNRALSGLFVTFQYPHDLPGITIEEFFYESFRALNKLPDSASIKQLFLSEFATIAQLVGFDEPITRTLEGFSGGQRKRLELIQVCLSRPKCLIFDEIDSGMDLDGKNAILQVIKYCRKINNQIIIIIITHDFKNMVYEPDNFCLLSDGQIRKISLAELSII